MQPKWEVADVLRQVPLLDYRLTIHQQKTLRALSLCRTSALGGHIDACDKCGNISISYNSCRNRHCPKCQGHKRVEWIENRTRDLLPCKYYHVVFTLPSELNQLALHKPRLVYDSLFKAAWQTLSQFGRTEDIRLGMVALLHTWGQNLSLHPHLHCIVPGGGVNQNDHWIKQVRSNKYLFSVKAISKVFRAKYVSELRKHKIGDQALFDQLFKKKWVVYAKRPFGGPAQVIEYLGRYSHKVAISNHRIKNVTNTEVSFGYKDYRQNGWKKVMTLQHNEFVRRFAQHILPNRFVRIRHYGILSSSWKRSKLQALQKSLGIERPEQNIKTKLRKCTCCKIGTLVTIKVFREREPPKEYVSATLKSPLA